LTPPLGAWGPAYGGEGRRRRRRRRMNAATWHMRRRIHVCELSNVMALATYGSKRL